MLSRTWRVVLSCITRVIGILVIGVCFFFQAEDGIRDVAVTGVQTCALPIFGHDAGIGGAVRSIGQVDVPVAVVLGGLETADPAAYSIDEQLARGARRAGIPGPERRHIPALQHLRYRRGLRRECGERRVDLRAPAVTRLGAALSLGRRFGPQSDDGQDGDAPHSAGYAGPPAARCISSSCALARASPAARR